MYYAKFALVAEAQTVAATLATSPRLIRGQIPIPSQSTLTPPARGLDRASGTTRRNSRNTRYVYGRNCDPLFRVSMQDDRARSAHQNQSTGLSETMPSASYQRSSNQDYAGHASVRSLRSLIADFMSGQGYRRPDHHLCQRPLPTRCAVALALAVTAHRYSP